MKKKYVYVLIGLSIAILASVLTLALASWNKSMRVSLPSAKGKLNNYYYEMDIKSGTVNKIDLHTGTGNVIIPIKIKTLGIIIFKNRIFFIKANNNVLTSTDLQGKNMKSYQKCNDYSSLKPLFLLGRHIYYYNEENVLCSIDASGREDIVGLY